MTREEKVAEARKMRTCGWTYREIGEDLWVAKSTVMRWLVPGRAERDRAASRAYKARNREQVREYDRRYTDENRATCPECGHRYGKGSGRINGGPRAAVAFRNCPNCIHLRRQRVVGMWAQGVTMKQMAVALGWTPNHLGVELIHMRERGYSLPYRQRLSRPKHPEQVAA